MNHQRCVSLWGQDIGINQVIHPTYTVFNDAHVIAVLLNMLKLKIFY